MRRYIASRSFGRMFQKLHIDVREKFIERAQLFVVDSRNPLLNDHALTAQWAGHRSINVTGDYRAVYRELIPNVFEFVAIGTHHQLFGK